MITWGELRSLNAAKLTGKMVTEGKGNRISFKISSSSNSVWVLITKEEHEATKSLYNEIDRLKTKLKTIMNVAEL